MAAGVEKMWKTDWLMYMNEMQMQDGIMHYINILPNRRNVGVLSIMLGYFAKLAV